MSSETWQRGKGFVLLLVAVHAPSLEAPAPRFLLSAPDSESLSTYVGSSMKPR